VAPSALLTDVHPVGLSEIAAHAQIIRIGCARRVLAGAVSGVVVDVWQLAPARGFRVAATIAEIGSPDIAVLPVCHQGVPGEEVPVTKRTALWYCVRKVGTTTSIRRVGADGSDGETH